MKTSALLGLLIASQSAFALDLEEPKSLFTETFEATLYANNGAITCRDKAPGNNPKALPGWASFPNEQVRYGKRLSDPKGRLDHFRSFHMDLAEGVTCKDIESKIPRGNGRVTVKRELLGLLHKDEDHTSLVMRQVASATVAEGLVFVGEYDWTDFVVENRQIDWSREIMLQLFDRDTWENSSEKRIRITNLSCKSSPLFIGRFQLSVSVEDASPNTLSVERAFDSEADCRDAATELAARLGFGEDSLIQNVHLSRSLTMVQDATGRRYRNETVSFSLLGTKFVGKSHLALW